MRRRGEELTDWARVEAMTDEEVEAAIDPEEEGAIDWGTVQAGILGPKERLTVLLGADIAEWFKAQGMGYQTLINSVLRDYVAAQQRRAVAAGGRFARLAYSSRVAGRRLAR